MDRDGKGPVLVRWNVRNGPVLEKMWPGVVFKLKDLTDPELSTCEQSSPVGHGSGPFPSRGETYLRCGVSAGEAAAQGSTVSS